MFDGDGRSTSGYAVEGLDLVEPFALNQPFLEVEAGRSGIAGRPTSLVRLDRHVENLVHKKNKTRTNADLTHVGK
jgi:hypothetical protein